MKCMTELAGGELCLPQRPHNQVGAARRRSEGRLSDDFNVVGSSLQMFDAATEKTRLPILNR